MEFSFYQDSAVAEHGFYQPYRGTIETVSHTVTITVNPCNILSYSIDSQPADMNIPFAASVMTSDSYGMLQTPDCGYPETVEVLQAPSFATHQAAQKNFLV